MRVELETKTLAELQNILEETNKTFFDKLNNSDRNNKRRLIRYVEITQQTANNKQQELNNKTELKYNTLIIGLTWPKAVLHERIERRLRERLDKEDLVEEVKGLHDTGVSWERLESFGLEYKFISQYLQEKISYEEMFDKLNTAINQFAKRQMTWFKRWEKSGKEIIWENNYDQAKKEVEEFLLRG